MTALGQRFGASITETAGAAQGNWDRDGRYSSLAEGSHDRSIDFAVHAGVRISDHVESTLEGGFRRESMSGPGMSHAETAFGDVVGRVRWDAVDEPMAWQHEPWPAVTFIASLRAPTGDRAPHGPSGTTGSMMSGMPSQGLGAWEPALAVLLERHLPPRWRFLLLGEGAYRFADSSLGFHRQLAPRVLGRAGIHYLASDTFGVGLLTDLGWEDNLTVEGRAREGTSERLWALGAFVYTMAGSHLRWGSMLRWTPPVDGASENAVAATSLSIALSWAE
jgi:hypothetical protein